MVNCPGPVISFNKKLNPDSSTPDLLYLYLQPYPCPLHKWRGRPGSMKIEKQ